MNKFTYEKKLKAVKAYLAGQPSKKIIENYKIGTHAQLLFWVKQYKTFGEDILKEKRTHQEYTPDYKLKVLQWKQTNTATYEATALKFGISSPSIIYQWQKLLNKGELLKPTKKRGRPSLNEKPLSTSERIELEKLRKQNQALIQENHYLKDLVS